MTLERGGEATFTVRVNIPLLCLDGQPCYLELKMYDEDDDYTCQNSTIAFRVFSPSNLICMAEKE